jgi:hypothetical protein
VRALTSSSKPLLTGFLRAGGVSLRLAVPLMREILLQLFHWTAHHQGIGIEVSSYLYAGDTPSLIDPMLPAGGVHAVEELGRPQAILLTNRHHLRHSERFAAAFGCPVLCHEAGLHEFADRGPAVEGFSFGDQLAPGIEALEVGAICPEETALHIAAGDGALAFADGIIHYGGEIGFVPASLLGDEPETVKRGVRESIGRLLERDFDAVLFAHGDPLASGGKEALRRFVEGGRAGSA